MEGRIQEHILREWREGYRIYLQRMEGRIGEYLQRMEGRIQENIYKEWRVGYRRIYIENGGQDIGKYLQRMEGRIQENIYREWRVTGYRRIFGENGGQGRTLDYNHNEYIKVFQTSKNTFFFFVDLHDYIFFTLYIIKTFQFLCKQTQT